MSAPSSRRMRLRTSTPTPVSTTAKALTHFHRWQGGRHQTLHRPGFEKRIRTRRRHRHRGDRAAVSTARSAAPPCIPRALNAGQLAAAAGRRRCCCWTSPRTPRKAQDPGVSRLWRRFQRPPDRRLVLLQWHRDRHARALAAVRGSEEGLSEHPHQRRWTSPPP